MKKNMLNSAIVKEYLKTIGMNTFIKYFESFKQNYNDTSNDILLENFNNEEWSQNSKKTKASIGKKIFKEGLEIEALEVVTSSSRVGEGTSIKAKELLQQYELNTPTIEYTKTIDVDKEQEVLLEIYKFAVNEGLDIGDIVSSMLEGINEVLGSDKKASFREIEDGYKFEVQFGDSKVEILEVSAEVAKSINLDDYKMDTLKKRLIRKKDKEIKRIFKSRLNTQNRKYSNGLCYMPTIFKKLEIDFTQNIDNQLSNIFVFIKQNNQSCEVNVNDISEIRIEKGQVFGKLNGSKVELFFKYDGQLHSFEGYVDAFRDISLGHRKSVHRILDEIKDSLPTLKQFSDIVIKENVNIKTKQGAKLIVEEILKANIDLDDLKRELAQIEKEMTLELIPLKVNIAMGKN